MVSPKQWFVALAAICAIGCDTTNPEPLSNGEFFSLFMNGGLRQTVTIDPVSPSTGDRVMVWSWLENRADTSVEVIATFCGPRLGGDLDIARPADLFTCQAISGGATLAPGDSLMDGIPFIMRSPSGQYTLTVQHALDPEHIMEIPINVR